MAMPGAEKPARERLGLANVFVLVALLSMLIGAILVLAARETFVTDVGPGEDALVFAYTAPAWDPFGHPMEAHVYGAGNITVAVNGPPANATGEIVLWVNETSGFRNVQEGDTFTIDVGGRVSWWEEAEPGETWHVEVQNGGTGQVRVTAELYCRSYYVVGGFLVGIGVLGFVGYRMGMRRSQH